MSQRPEVVLIAAMGSNGVIGIENRLPWRLPEDLKRFKARTLGQPILMGRKTWDSLGRPLPGRRNLVITRQAGWQAEGAEAYPSIEAALAACDGLARVFVIGGGEVYRQSLPVADALYLTEVDLAPAGDAYFPEFDRNEWQETARESAVDETSGARFAWVDYHRKG
ncbi:dihydrofolate reductase [Silvimonas amylolytica]|uniref:Dihydrofolate reductase n=1 Tax=Silvimonas amylolytica TaxID=449663 RepID=A0ABQ2PGA1_9NEIS|nr:dihydrofolate reductase [Silvimonas amylolytica]GGP24286.1 dihydrofolate reductase [Silvimonas amylolytica]